MNRCLMILRKLCGSIKNIFVKEYYIIYNSSHSDIRLVMNIDEKYNPALTILKKDAMKGSKRYMRNILNSGMLYLPDLPNYFWCNNRYELKSKAQIDKMEEFK